MRVKTEKLATTARKEVSRLMMRELPSGLAFHNLIHTMDVVDAVKEIGYHCQLNEEEREIVNLAAWFHDTGFTVTYTDHEIASQDLAESFLQKIGYPTDKLEKVLACISSTELPQQPSNTMEKVLCDADFFHLSSTEFIDTQWRLREECKVVYREYSKPEWMQQNIDLLENHSYFTEYGRNVLEMHKKVNIMSCRRFEKILKTA